MGAADSWGVAPWVSGRALSLPQGNRNLRAKVDTDFAIFFEFFASSRKIQFALNKEAEAAR
jgi:hypothetical protein